MDVVVTLTSSVLLWSCFINLVSFCQWFKKQGAPSLKQRTFYINSPLSILNSSSVTSLNLNNFRNILIKTIKKMLVQTIPFDEILLQLRTVMTEISPAYCHLPSMLKVLSALKFYPVTWDCSDRSDECHSWGNSWKTVWMCSLFQSRSVCDVSLCGSQRPDSCSNSF